MKKLIVLAVLILSVVVVKAQINVTVHTFENFNLHIYTSSESMGDVSLLVEGKDKLVVFEPQSFYKSIADFNAYTKKLNKPIEKIVANYHAGGLAELDMRKVVMVEPMVEFMKSPKAQGMMKHFANVFKGAMDTRLVDVKHTIPQEGLQTWGGIKFNFLKGMSTDFPASSVNIGNKVYYTHFAPNKMHPSPMQLKNREAVDAMLNELEQARESGCEFSYIISRKFKETYCRM